ncbi:hypothetical protein [Streptomyces sp. NPDC086787]|uniref:hypothetical protein n=1 Tax=Streptomyces sp. NPDC086787 TaxID=3365759 RepID=UPI0038193539
MAARTADSVRFSGSEQSLGETLEKDMAQAGVITLGGTPSPPDASGTRTTGSDFAPLLRLAKQRVFSGAAPDGTCAR